VTPNFVVTAGLRYSLLQPPYEANGNQATTNIRMGQMFLDRAQSGMDYFTAATMLSEMAYAGVDPSDLTIAPIPFWENLFPVPSQFPWDAGQGRLPGFSFVLDIPRIE